jgi:hypothetical protein
MQHRSGAWAIASDTVLGKKSICFDSTITKIFRHKCCITHTLFFEHAWEITHTFFFFFFFAKLRLSELMLHTNQNFENEKFLLSYNILCHISDMKGKKKISVLLWKKNKKYRSVCSEHGPFAICSSWFWWFMLTQAMGLTTLSSMSL